MLQVTSNEVPLTSKFMRTIGTNIVKPISCPKVRTGYANSFLKYGSRKASR